MITIKHYLIAFNRRAYSAATYGYLTDRGMIPAITQLYCLSVIYHHIDSVINIFLIHVRNAAVPIIVTFTR